MVILEDFDIESYSVILRGGPDILSIPFISMIVEEICIYHSCHCVTLLRNIMKLQKKPKKKPAATEI